MHAKGTCLCGSVTITTALKPNVGACHCQTCRRWGGGPFLTVEGGTEVTIDGTPHLAVYNSSDWAERGFCRNCGSHLFYRLKRNNLHVFAAGIFGDLADFKFDHQVFVDEKPAFYDFANDTHNMTGAECFAAFSENP